MKNKYTIEDALELARNLIYGPIPDKNDPTPTIKQAIEAISDKRLWTFNWLTGQAALKVLKEGKK